MLIKYLFLGPIPRESNSISLGLGDMGGEGKQEMYITEL